MGNAALLSTLRMPSYSNLLTLVKTETNAKLFAICILVVFLAACSTPNSPATSTRPQWLISPERSGFISVVGSAPKQATGGTEAQQRVALMKAHQQLGQMVRVRVENIVRQVQQVQNGKATLDVASNTRLTSSAALNLGNAQESALWLDPVNGDLYLLLELPESSGNLLP